jgi:uncharacterized membrane protein YfcA
MRVWSDPFRARSKAETRAVLHPFNIAVLGLTFIVFATKGAYAWKVLQLIGVALPVTMISAQIGISMFNRVNDNQSRRFIIALMFLSRIILILRNFVA